MIALDLQDIRKVFRIYQAPSQRLKEIIMRRPFHSEFTALDNISFSVRTGETFGIIGENGAGKSTLLRILARTLKPSSGSLTINGRSAALLELGAGFNPELTGEENIYLNAYLLGLSNSEIDARKEEMIAFSELGDFIKRPVKTYSSGMYVRLAFSIATSVDPDILIIDEALSVGDLHFQKKCIDRMTNFRKAGKTIIFCSHSLYHVQELCNKTIWLKDGSMVMFGGTEKVINGYQNYMREKDKKKVDLVVRAEDSPVFIEEVSVVGADGKAIESVISFEPLYLKIRIRTSLPDLKGHIGFALVRNDEEPCFATATHLDSYKPVAYTDGMEIKVFFSSFPLLNGVYFFRVSVGDETALLPYDTAASPSFTVSNSRKELGMVFLDHSWEL